MYGYGNDYLCDKCGDVLMKCQVCGEIFCPHCSEEKESENCPICNSNEIVAADIEDLVFEEEDDVEN
jgi:uncharacterized Zn finger protein (UPF0148 family)